MAAVLVLSGCGQTESEAAREALHAFINATLAGDGHAACARLSPFEQRITEGLTGSSGNCPEGIRAFEDDDFILKYVRDNHGPVEVIDDDTAVVPIPPPDSGSSYDPIRIEKIDGRWRISDLTWINKSQS